MVLYTAAICCASVGLWYNGISMGCLYMLMGVLISAAVIPASLTLLWSRQNRWAATLTPMLGTACAITAWLVTASKKCGKLDVDCTGSNDAMLAGNLTALLSPLAFIPALCLIFGFDKYDWNLMLAIRKVDDHDVVHSAGMESGAQQQAEGAQDADFATEQRKLKRSFKVACVITTVMSAPLTTIENHLRVTWPHFADEEDRALSFLVLWLMPLYGSGYIFSKPFFTGWVAVGIIWIFCSFAAVGLYPAWESRVILTSVVQRIVTGQRADGRPRTEPMGVNSSSDMAVPVKPFLTVSSEAEVGAEKKR